MNQPLKVCFLKRFLKQKGGLEKQAQLIIDKFASFGASITLLTEELEGTFVHETILTKKCQGLSFQKVLNFNTQTQKFLETQKYDAIFGFDRTVSQTIMRLGNGIHRAFLKEKQKYAPYFIKHFLKNPNDFATLHLEKKAFSHPNLQIVIANSNMVKDELLSYYPLDEKKIHVIHNGVEWKKNGAFFEEGFALDKNDLSRIELLFVGHGFKRKGLLFLLKALSHLRSKDWHLHVVGEDKHRSSYEQFVKKINLDKKVTFYGNVKDSTPFFQKGDLCLIPSIYDPFANVTVEALSFGCPVLSSKKNGGHEVIQPFMGGIIEDLQDDISFAKLIELNMKKKERALALKIRNEVEYLDLSYQLEKLLQLCVNR
jgi:UDP-glucose:(heptosyl)LPS alpha-1,3-glucosyltransferase